MQLMFNCTLWPIWCLSFLIHYTIYLLCICYPNCTLYVWCDNLWLSFFEIKVLLIQCATLHYVYNTTTIICKSSFSFSGNSPVFFTNRSFFSPLVCRIKTAPTQDRRWFRHWEKLLSLHFQNESLATVSVRCRQREGWCPLQHNQPSLQPQE